MADWIILRCSPSKTLRLAESLAADGFDVWTPVRREKIRKPRWNVSREVRIPLMPSFVFACADQRDDLLTLANMPERPRRGIHPAHAGFSVFHHLDRVPMIADTALEPLRLAEKPAIERRRYTKFPRNSEVRVTGGSFEGMIGIVDRGDLKGAHVWLSLFGRHMRAEIPASLLQPIDARMAA